MRNRSNLLVLLGIAFFVVGGIIVYVVTNGSGGGSSTSSSAPVTVVEAKVDIPAGSQAKDLIAKGNLKVVKVQASQLVPGAVQSVNQLDGATFVQGFAAGSQITTAGLQAVHRGYKLAAGYEAQAITLDFISGDAGYVNVGDKINLYAAYSTAIPIKGTTLPKAQLLLSGVRVLDVSQVIPANTAAAADGTVRATGGSVTYLLAVKTTDVEKLVFATKFESLVATLTDGQSPQSTKTPGVSGDNVLDSNPDANPTAG